MHIIERISNPIELTDQAKQAPCRLFFGGSFDPPHRGHCQLARAVANKLSSNSRVIYVPAARSPFKDYKPTANIHRLQMLNLSLAEFEQWEIWEQELTDAELNNGEPSYWADTWQIINSMNLGGVNAFLIGADQLLSMHRWHRYDEFWRDAVVMLRASDNSTPESPTELIDKLRKLEIWNDEDLEFWETRIVCTPTVDASSTFIRDSLKDSSKRNAPIKGLDRGVHEYILANELYHS